MDINNETSERAMQVLYEQRINGLGKCLMLWASHQLHIETVPVKC